MAAALDAEAALGSGRDFEKLGARIEVARDALAAVLTRVGLSVCPAAAGYFLVADVSATGLGDFECATCTFPVPSLYLPCTFLGDFECATSAARALTRDVFSARLD